MKRFIEEEGIDCDFTLTRSFDVWCNEDSARKAKQVYDSMVEEGLDYMDDVFFYEEDGAEGVSSIYDSLIYHILTSFPRHRLLVSKEPLRMLHLQLERCPHTNSSYTWPKSSLVVALSIFRHIHLPYPSKQQQKNTRLTRHEERYSPVKSFTQTTHTSLHCSPSTQKTSYLAKEYVVKSAFRRMLLLLYFPVLT
jgi:hypothetical protein